MGLKSLFQFKSRSPAPAEASRAATDSNELIQEARQRARRRLIGAAVLLGVGIVGFPLLFETQPRPIPVDIPIEIPSRETAAPLVAPGARPGAARAAQAIDASESAASVDPAQTEQGEAQALRPAAVAPSASGRLQAASASPVPKGEASKADAPKPTATEAPRPEPIKPPEPKPVVKPPEPKPAAQAADKPAAKLPEKAPEKPAEKVADKARPAATDAAADTGRWVVQIGAFAEATSAREARLKVEAMGLKTYTQVIESSTGRRIRVRVGPYANKAEAEKAAARIRGGGLPAALLLL